jgi:hypothetical protein
LDENIFLLPARSNNKKKEIKKQRHFCAIMYSIKFAARTNSDEKTEKNIFPHKK